jgi:hypothetical protein
MPEHISEATEPVLRGNAQFTTRDANLEVAGGWDGRVYGQTGVTARRLFPTRESRPETRLISRRATVPAPSSNLDRRRDRPGVAIRPGLPVRYSRDSTEAVP